MAGTTGIEWTDATWNPVTGCHKVSPGCAHCYAETVSRRFGHTSAPWTPGNAAQNVRLHPERLGQPLRWKRPRRVFVNSMSDLFHDLVPDEFIARVLDVMAATDWHKYQVLTKRPERMARWFETVGTRVLDNGAVLPRRLVGSWDWPLPNVWLGVSVENQHWADHRIPVLLDIPAPVRFLSCEPLLGPIDLTAYLQAGGIHWVIDGGESGPGRRPADYGWFRSIRDQCLEYSVPYFHKQGNAPHPGKDRMLDGRAWDGHPPIRPGAGSNRAGLQVST